jgi:multidrug efflux pump subunit AcrB
MWIVRLALRRPYTFVVAALLLILMTPFVLVRTPTDIFPAINIPVVSVIWSYTGLPADQIAQRLVYSEERALTTTVDNIEHIESTSYDSFGVIKVFFHPTVNPSTAVAQLTAVSQTILRQLPPGTTPPLIIQYSASTVSILQFGISSTKLSEQEVFDIALNQIRVGLISVPGVSIPYPYGGKQRVVSVDLDLKALEANNLVESDVVTAMSTGSLTFPSGTAKIGGKEVPVDLNVNPPRIDLLNDLPIKSVGGTVIHIGDVAQVRDGYMPQENIVRQDGVRSTLIQIFKNGSASTLSVAAGVKAAMAKILQTVTSDVQVKQFADQSIFVKAAISGVVREGVIAACLTAIMLLLFLASWRATIIVAVSIPLSILTSLAVLSALGETINLMTLGGLALAVGILVDDATVELENVHRQMALGKPTHQAILDGAQEIALPAFVSTLCICIVFVPMFFLSGVSRYLFVPLAEAVVFALLASYGLTRTLVPTMVMWFYKNKPYRGEAPDPVTAKPWVRPFVKLANGFDKVFERLKEAYGNLLGKIMERRAAFVICFLSFCIATWLLVPFLGQNFFPAVDAGELRLHVRAPTGTRIEQTAKLVDEVEAAIRREIPATELAGILDNMGLPVSGINLSYNDSGISGPADADILVSLKPNHKPTANYVRNLRLSLNREFPGITFYFLPADIVSETINFGLPAPFDIQVVGRNQQVDQQVANSIAQKVRHVRGAVDVRVQQPNDLQRIEFAVDRTKASELGLTESNVASSVLLALSGSSQVTPTYWLDPTNGIQYLVNIRVPETQTTTLSELNSIPLSASKAGTANAEVLSNVATTTRITSQPIYSHYNVMPVVDVYGGVAARDLGGVISDIKPIIAEAQKNAPRGTDIVLRGQASTMNSSFLGLGIGMLGAIVLIYLLLVVNFQSWLDPFIILTALTGALAGVIWGLHATSTTLSVPAMMGAIMSLGVATANSVLVVTFARIHLQEGKTPSQAAWEAGTGRLRPVIMTATAMVIGMFPMALGLGDGGEQNAPLGRAVIGGLILATFATLLFVPVVFSLLHRQVVATAATEPKENVPSKDLAEAIPVTSNI